MNCQKSRRKLNNLSWWSVKFQVLINLSSAATPTVKIFSIFQIFPPPTQPLYLGLHRREINGEFRRSYGNRILVEVAGTALRTHIRSPDGDRRPPPPEEARRRRSGGSVVSVLAESPSAMASLLPSFRLCCHGLPSLPDCSCLWILRLLLLHSVTLSLSLSLSHTVTDCASTNLILCDLLYRWTFALVMLYFAVCTSSILALWFCTAHCSCIIYRMSVSTCSVVDCYNSIISRM